MSHEHSHDHSHTHNDHEHEHHGHHDHPQDHAGHHHTNEETLPALEKLKKLLPYLINHNREHSQELKTWNETAKNAGAVSVAEELAAVVKLSDQIVEHLTKAQNALSL